LVKAGLYCSSRWFTLPFLPQMHEFRINYLVEKNSCIRGNFKVEVLLFRGPPVLLKEAPNGLKLEEFILLSFSKTQAVRCPLQGDRGLTKKLQQYFFVKKIGLKNIKNATHRNSNRKTKNTNN